MQQKLHSATSPPLLNLQFRHRKLVLQKILATTKLHMHKVPELLQSPYIKQILSVLNRSGGERHAGCSLAVSV